jgi:putative Holliday junction resolvase
VFLTTVFLTTVFLAAVRGRTLFGYHNLVRILGIDHGDRHFGLALSDEGEIIASPREVLHGEESVFAAVEVLIRDEEIGLIVLGLPLNMDGTAGPRVQIVEAFGDRLVERFGLPVEYWDERLTTLQAEQALRASGLSARKRREKVDKVAAQIFLQSFLDARSNRDLEADTEPSESG